MFNIVHNNKRIIQIVLAVVMLPFAFFGVDSYVRDREGAEAVATFEGHSITQQEFAQALRERQEMLQQLSGGRADAAQLDNPELRYAVLDNMIQQRLLLDRAQRSGMIVSERQLQGVIGEIPAFQENGKFSYEQYERLLKSQNLTPLQFEARVRQQIIMQQLDDAFSDSNFIPRTVAERVTRIAEQQREVSQAIVSAERFVPQVKLEEGAAKKYYESHQEEFRIPEQVRVEYVALSMDQLMAQAKVDPEEVKKFYEANRKQFEVKETRQASHILIAADPAGGAAAKEKAKARAEEIYQQIKAKPDSFAELAKKYSQDPGSAEKGGDLGYFSRGSMVKAFDDAVFKMKAGEISPPVESEYGYHIIKLTGVRPGRTSSPEEVGAKLEDEVKKQAASRQYAELAEKLNNLVFEQSDTLKPAADLLHVPVRQSGWITRSQAPDALLNNPRLLQSIFSDDVLHNKRNTEAIEVARGTLVAARVIDHKPTTIKPFDEVSPGIVKTLTAQRAAQLAAQEGRQAVENLKQGKPAQLNFSAPQLVSRADTKALPDAAMKRLFKTPVAHLPSYAGVENSNGDYVVLKITRVVEPEKVAVDKQKSLAQSIEQASSQAELAAYVADLRKKADVKIKQDLLEKKQ
jgi:peptidyl-prolyl cis-trans isomerase D